MPEEQFKAPVAGGVLAGHRGGQGPLGLLLHGGPALPDYTEGCAAELAPLPQRSSTQTAALIQGAKIALIENCGHFPWWERPGELLRALQPLLERAP